MSSGLAVLQFNELSIGAFRMIQQFGNPPINNVLGFNRSLQHFV